MRRTRTLDDVAVDRLEGRRVLARVDYNVPVDEEGRVADPGRIDATLPTLEALLEAGARVLLASHLGRPKGAADPALSLAPVAEALAARLGATVPLLTAAPGTPELAAGAEAVGEGRAALLENVRFHAGETENEPKLAAALGELGEVFVGDAFGTAHRAHASNVGAAEVIRRRGGPAVAGHLMARELHYLRGALREPARPFVAVLGGAKISGKIDLIEAILPRVDRILIGGAMATTFLRALGLETGRSLVEEDRVEMARELLERAGDRLLLPVDVVVADEIEPGARPRPSSRTGIRPADRVGDIGPETRELFAREIGEARTILWNGPVGVFEVEPFAPGTLHVARAVAEAADAGATAIVGGGDSAAAAEQAGVSARMSHVSTGGGAALDLLAGKELPGVDVLDTVEED